MTTMPVTFLTTTSYATTAVKPLRPTLVKEHLLWPGGLQQGCKTGSLVQTRGGALLAAWYGCRSGAKSDSEETGLWISSYSDGQWSLPQELFYKEGHHVWNPVLLKTASGQLVLFFRIFAPKEPEPQQVKYGVRDFIYLSMRSSNDGVSWSTPEPLPAGVTGPVKCAPLVMQDGTWIVPSAKEGRCWIECSKDEGKNWERFGPVQHPDGQSGLTEPSLVLDNQGDIRVFFRNRMKANQDRYVLTCTFSLATKTFSPLHSTNVAHPDAGIDVMRGHDGRLLMIANTSFDKRSPLALLDSHDEGETWKEVLTLEDVEGDFAQPALIQTADRHIHALYSWCPQGGREKNIKHLILALPKTNS